MFNPQHCTDEYCEYFCYQASDCNYHIDIPTRPLTNIRAKADSSDAYIIDLHNIILEKICITHFRVEKPPSPIYLN